MGVIPFLARVCVFCVAASYAWTAPGTKLFKIYIAAQCLATLALFDSEFALGRSSVAYVWVYLISTIIVLSAGLVVAIDAFRIHKARWLALLAALGIALAFSLETIASLPHVVRNDWIAIGEASTLFVSGIMIGVSAPYQSTGKKQVCLTLSVLWIGLACFRLCYRIYRLDPTWIVANQVLPCMMVTGAVAWCGVQLRSNRP